MTAAWRPAVALVLVASFVATGQSPVVVEPAKGSAFTRPYRAATVAPPRLGAGGTRLRSLMRDGKIYLTAQDAIALALENSLDLEVARYGPVIAGWQYRRALAGGPLRGVTSGNSVVNQATSGQGVAGSQVSAGLSGSSGGGSGGGGGGAIVSQIGPVTANLDPVLLNTTAFSHTTTPQAVTLQSQTSALIDTRSVSNSVLQQGLLSGGYAQISVNDSWLKENSPTNILNPSVAPVAQIYVRHNFLSAFGTQVNSRFIRVAARGQDIAGETFRSEVMNTVSSVLNLYWDVAASMDEIKAREAILGVAQKFKDDTTAQVRLGAVARVDLLRAEAEWKSRQRELDLAVATRRQRETLLKNAITHDGLSDPVIEAAEVVALDTIQPPGADDLPPLRELVARALKNRPDIRISQWNDENQETSALGTRNGLLPSLQGIAAVSASGLAGTAQKQTNGAVPDEYFVGGNGKAFGQVLRNDFKNRRAAVIFQGTLNNQIAQSDYGIDQLTLRQGDLVTRRSMNQLVVDISNQMIALRQARTRYGVAADSSALQTELLSKERQKFALGDSTIQALIAAQRAQAAAQSAEVAARAGYQKAQLALEQVLGETLERNQVSLEQALAGVVRR